MLGAGLANIFEGACPNFPLKFEEIFSRARGDFGEQNKILESSINFY